MMCDECQTRPAGHGHFGLYCEGCAELPYGVSVDDVAEAL